MNRAPVSRKVPGRGHEIRGFCGFSRMNANERRDLLGLVPQMGRVLEIGTYHGTTIASWAADRPRVFFQSVDPFLVAFGTPAGSEAIWRANARANQDLFVGTAAAFVAAGGWSPFAVVVVDGAHDEENCRRDLGSALAVLGPGGLILVHDFVPGNAKLAGIRKAIRSFCRSEGFWLRGRRHRTAILIREAG